MTADHQEAVLPLDDEFTTAPFARRYTIAVLSRWLGDCADHAELVDDAALITTELVTNALRHSTPPTACACNCGTTPCSSRSTTRAPRYPCPVRRCRTKSAAAG
ncbi:hypothetical protein [Streptomyces sp. MNP-20]|uniref:hypothetical protein n=1 Tax=Streptomyces sp. MNP-20 TaxID=2721165 RepID=UPI001553EC73|nr:hypothetical protein [Streptomyces sp. MNP-20]